jgi:DNA topoisomerase-1
MNLVIVESPTKARKLTAYLGKDFKVEASVGHVRDLPKKSLGVDVEHDYKPEYEVSDDKQKVVANLRKLAKDADKIYLAMDPDREGEAIAWHIKYLLQHDKNGKKTKVTKESSDFLRATFNQITKSAVLSSIEKPGKINIDLVDAQQARRVLDRLVGYKVSPVLWKKIRRGLSAGRVQSVALRLIVEREKEIQKFKAEEYWEFEVAAAQDAVAKKAESVFKDGKVKGNVKKDILILNLEKKNNKKIKVDNKKDADEVVDYLKDADYIVQSIDKTERRRQSLPPFTTSLLQQAAANKLGFSSKQTMSLAQNLYEEGLITYHRTDSFNLASSAVEMAREYIANEYGQEFLPKEARVFSKKSKNAQEAHEAIRVTHVKTRMEDLPNKAKLTERHARLYDLIWRRFVASQMEAAVYDQTTVLVEAKKQSAQNKYLFKTVGSVMKFIGWRKLFKVSEDRLLPELTEGEKLNYLDINPMQKFTQPPARYNDASLVKELEKRGIGRPSTYASIISVIVDRAYVERKEKRFFATPVGITVSDFLVKNFDEIMDYDFTAEMEEDLDRISLGKKEWVKVVDSLYKPLAKKIKTVDKDADRVQVPVEKTGEKCPDCAKQVEAGELKKSEAGEIVIRTGRFGKFKSCSRYPDCKFTENIIETLPDQKCPLCAEGDVIVRNTRWGKPFFGCGRYPDCDWASWKKPSPDYKVTKKEWEEIKKRREEWKAKRAKTMAAKKGSSSKATTKKASKATAKKTTKKKATTSKKK